MKKIQLKLDDSTDNKNLFYGRSCIFYIVTCFLLSINVIWYSTSIFGHLNLQIAFKASLLYRIQCEKNLVVLDLLNIGRNIIGLKVGKYLKI